MTFSAKHKKRFLFQGFSCLFVHILKVGGSKKDFPATWAYNDMSNPEKITAYERRTVKLKAFEYVLNLNLCYFQ